MYVCASVYLSAVGNDPVVRPRAQGVSPTPEKVVSAKYISSQTFEVGGLCHTYLE